MAKARQLTVPCANRPRTPAQIAKVLGDAKVNILACLTTTSGTEGSVQAVVDNTIMPPQASNYDRRDRPGTTQALGR